MVINAIKIGLFPLHATECSYKAKRDLVNVIFFYVQHLI